MINTLPPTLKGEALANATTLHQHMHTAYGMWMFSPRMAEEAIGNVYWYIVRGGRRS